MILMDLHAHSSGISTCCLICGKIGVDAALEAGVGGFALTNHYADGYVACGKYASYEALAKAYVEEFHRVRDYGAKKGFPVLFGVEVTAEWDDRIHLLIYGVDEAFILSHPKICLYSLEEIYEAVHEWGGILIQAHPYRIEPRLQDLRFLDGVEISCHPHVRYGGSFAAEMEAIACENGKLLTCGGDYHGDASYRPQCGVYLPEEVTDGLTLKEYLCSAPQVTLCVHEPEGPVFDVHYQRKKL